MALITCPECGKEISDQAPACIHCGYPLPPKGPELLSPDEPNRFSVVLTAKCNYPENRRRTIRVLIDELGISKTEAEAYMDNTELGPSCCGAECPRSPPGISPAFWQGQAPMYRWWTAASPATWRPIPLRHSKASPSARRSGP